MGGGEWSIGVDVGGSNKGFHLAMLRGTELHIESNGILYPSDVLEAIEAAPISKSEIGVIGIDSPQNWAPGNQKSRPCERAYRREDLSGIYFTPNKARAARNKKKFYEWVENGMHLYDLLEKEGISKAIEVFPTGSWTRWCGKKGKLSRAKWTTSGIRALEKEFGFDVQGETTNQDKRDAVAAAVTAQLFLKDQATPITGAGDSDHKASLAPGIVIPDLPLP